MENWSKDTGIIIILSASDYRLAKASFASIKHFYPESNVSLLVDGDLKTDKALKDLCDKVITKKEVSNEFLRKNSFGWGITKMIAFWESPYENFILLDADTIINGRCFDLSLFKRYDIVLDKPKYEYSRYAIDQYFFKKDLIESRYPDFSYYDDPYANVGIIYGKRGIIPLEDYKKFLSILGEDKRTFPCPEQGWLNLVCFNWSRSGKIQFYQEDIQTIVQDYPKDELEQNYSIENPNRKNTVIHFAGNPKPYIWSDSGMSKTLLFFRNEYQQQFLSRKRFSTFFLTLEDVLNFISFRLPKVLNNRIYVIKRTIYLTYKKFMKR
jgi:hypothetical protein